MGPHERAAAERERLELLRRVNKTQMEGRRLDELEELLGPLPEKNGDGPRPSRG